MLLQSYHRSTWWAGTWKGGYSSHPIYWASMGTQKYATILGCVLETKILWQWLERNFHHWRLEDFWRALPERIYFLHYVLFLGMWFTSYLQICICHCGACLKGDTLVQHPAFPGLHVRCQGLLNGYFLDGGFPVLCGWLVCADKVITTGTARKNKTPAKQEGWKSTFYSWSFLLV